MSKILSDYFFNRDAAIVAKELLGKYLVRKINDKEIALMITEVEVYDGFEDKASHAHRGKTKRNEVMFGDAGRFYVYLVYGMHWMLNVVTGEKDYPAAVLIRGVEGFDGPAKLTKFLKIDKKFNGKKANLPATALAEEGKETGLWIEDRGIDIKKKDIKSTPRIGVGYAGPIWSKKHYRFLLNGETAK